MNGKINKILEIIDQTKNLTLEERFELKRLLDKAERNLESYDLGRLISGIKDLISDLDDPEIFTDQTYLGPRYKDILSIVLEKIKREKRVIDMHDEPFFPAFDDYRPITFGLILRNLGEVKTLENGVIEFTPRDPDILQRNLDVANEDGMGYAASGFSKVFEAYQENTSEEKEIKLWI